MKLRLRKVKQEISEKIQQILGEKLRKIILYGSYARGDFDEESDIDIMVLADLTDDEIRKYEKQLIEMSSKIDLKYNVLTSIFVKNSEFFYTQVNVLPFYYNVKKDGKELYASQI
jgi:predicted nucleotidyltransferase